MIPINFILYIDKYKFNLILMSILPKIPLKLFYGCLIFQLYNIIYIYISGKKLCEISCLHIVSVYGQPINILYF